MAQHAQAISHLARAACAFPITLYALAESLSSVKAAAQSLSAAFGLRERPPS